MLPRFPEFRELDLCDRGLIAEYSEGFAPYSDFSFTNMIVWGPDHISELNGNLIIRTVDVIDGKTILTFLGSDRLDETAATLLETLSACGANGLRRVPEEIANRLDLNKFIVEADDAASDYIYSTRELSQLSGGKFSDVRWRINGLKRHDITIRQVELEDRTVRERVIEFHRGCRGSLPNGPTQIDSRSHPGLRLELMAFTRLMGEPKLLDRLWAYGVFLDGVIAGFDLLEQNGDHSQVVFWGFSREPRGLCSYCVHKVSRDLFGAGIKFRNHQEDLGLPGLRMAKRNLRPVEKLRKYTVINR